MLKRLMVVIAFLSPLLPLLASFLLEAGLASSELAAIERLAPQSAAQLSTLPDGQEILIEGRLDLQSTRSLDSLLISVVAGGTRADYLALQRGSVAAPAEMAALCAVLLVSLGLGLWLVRKQMQRYTQVAI